MRAGLMLFFVLLTLGCRKADEGSSELKWGQLKASQYDPATWLISAPPMSVIEVCVAAAVVNPDLHQTYTITALKKWASAVQRDKYLTFVPCKSDPKASITVSVVQESTDGTAYAIPTTRTIHIQTPEKYNVPSRELLMLHEVGHLWGLCDQYEGGLSFCDPDHQSTQLPDKAVMKYYETDLQKDDIDGMTDLTNRVDIPANKVWKDFLAAQVVPPPGTPVADAAVGGLFFAIEDVGAGRANFYVSTPHSVMKVAVCASDKETCVNDPNKRLEFVKEDDLESRTIYKSPEILSPVDGGTYTILGLAADDSLAVSLTLRLKDSSTAP